MRHTSFSVLVTVTTTNNSITATSAAAVATDDMPSLSSAPPMSSKPRRASNSISSHHLHNHSSSPLLFCRHCPTATATLDLLILILVLFSGTFLIASYLSYIFNSLSLLLPQILVSHSSALEESPLPYLLGFAVVFAAAVVAFEIFFCGGGGVIWSRRCDNPKCKGLKRAMEFDLQLQSEESLRSGPSEIDRLPWKGGTETNPDYECLRAELRKMAPVNGRAILLFRAKCGCPVAKLIGWGPKKGRRRKKVLTNAAANGDHR